MKTHASLEMPAAFNENLICNLIVCHKTIIVIDGNLLDHEAI